jgi:hypothetical protein
MDFTEKAVIRIEHWIRHNENHLQEYKTFAHELEKAGKHEGSQYLQEVQALIRESNNCLVKALHTIE